MTRFDELMKQRKPPSAKPPEQSDIQASEHSDAQESKSLDASASKPSKSRDSSYKRTTVYLRKQTHLKLRAAAMAEDRDMSDILNELAEQWLASRHSDV